MTPDPSPDFAAILRALAGHRVEFIVVGGICGVLHGAPIATFDVDIVHSRAPENIDRLLAALDALDAYYRGQWPRRIRPQRSHLSSPGHQLLMTHAGPLDLLGAIGAGLGYDNLLSHTLRLLDLTGPAARVQGEPIDAAVGSAEGDVTHVGLASTSGDNVSTGIRRRLGRAVDGADAPGA
jgi:hypothetical protein